jgi:hypothetical protein
MKKTDSVSLPMSQHFRTQQSMNSSVSISEKPLVVPLLLWGAIFYTRDSKGVADRTADIQTELVTIGKEYGVPR